MIDPIIELPDARRIPLSTIETDTASRARYLARFRGNAGDVLCLCRFDGIPMGVAHRESPQATYYLYPLHRSDPLRHAPACPHHFTPSVTDTEGVLPTQLPVVEVRDAKVSINIDVPLFRGQKRDEVAAEEQQEEQPKDKQPTARPPAPHGKPVSLLEFLFAQAQLNVWDPLFANRRGYGVIYRRLQEVVANVQIRRHDLAPLFYIAPPYHPDRDEEIRKGRDAFIARLAVRPNGRKWYGYVAGLLKGVELTERNDYVIRLAHFPMKLHMNGRDWEMFRNRWFAEVASPEKPEYPTFMLVHVERMEGPKRPWLYVKDMACLYLSDEQAYIPVSSTYERYLVQHLVAERRAFHKPLAVETEGQGGALLPSMILDDRHERTHLEILHGNRSPESLARFSERMDAYRAMGQEVWSWDVSKEDDGNPAMPLLPPRNAAPTRREVAPPQATMAVADA